MKILKNKIKNKKNGFRSGKQKKRPYTFGSQTRLRHFSFGDSLLGTGVTFVPVYVSVFLFNSAARARVITLLRPRAALCWRQYRSNGAYVCPQNGAAVLKKRLSKIIIKKTHSSPVPKKKRTKPRNRNNN